MHTRLTLLSAALITLVTPLLSIPVSSAEGSSPSQCTTEQSVITDVLFKKAFTASLLRVTGDPAFDVDLDLNHDGWVNLLDLNLAKTQMSSVRTVQTIAALLLKKAFIPALLSLRGDARFDAALDLNADGTINILDLNIAKLAFYCGMTFPQAPADIDLTVLPAAPQAPAVPAVHFTKCTGHTTLIRNLLFHKAFVGKIFTTKADATFDAALDLNGDGTINILDLQLMKNRLSNSETADGAADLLVQKAFAKALVTYDRSLDLNHDKTIDQDDMTLAKEALLCTKK